MYDEVCDVGGQNQLKKFDLCQYINQFVYAHLREIQLIERFFFSS